MERPSIALADWVIAHKIKQPRIVVDLTLQIINATHFLHRNNCFLMDVSLENVFVDEHNKIKVYFDMHDFNQDKNTIYSRYLEFQANKSDYFLYPPEVLCSSISPKNLLRKDRGDVWAIGVLIKLMLVDQMTPAFLEKAILKS